MQSICLLGRQPALGKAELESIFGHRAIKPLHYRAAVQINTEPDTVNINRLGGTIKAGKVLAHIPSTDWRAIAAYLINTAPEHEQYVPEGKLRIGLSAYGLRVSHEAINRTGLEVKKAVKKTGRSVRVVPNNDLELSSAQVLHNQLTGPTGWELLLVGNGDHTILAQTTGIQDINAYAARDQARPKRDAKVGMLPPKLAQIIINLAAGSAAASPVVLDPFCGTGVVLQEALLMGNSVYGSDIDLRMVEYSQANIEWLRSRYPATRDHHVFIEAGDATQHEWTRPFSVVACETYLGRPLFAPLKSHDLTALRREVGELHAAFLKNIGRQIQSGTRLCLAVPAWRAGNRFEHLPTLDHLSDLGYNRLSFEYTRSEDLIYFREDQLVARQLVVLEKN